MQIINLGINTPQTFGVNIITPSNNQAFKEGENIQLYANATTNTGVITKVEFYVNNILSQEVTSSPYLVNWIPSAVGNYTIKAKAYNSSGNSIESSQVSISVNPVDKTDLTGDIYRLKNVVTGKFLQAQTISASSVLMNDSGEGQDKEWIFTKSNNYYNIDSEVTGILRATGSGFSPPYAIVNTTKASPATDSDKIWIVHYLEADDTYRFEAGSNGRFLYHDADGSVYNTSVLETDARSKWKAISKSTSLSNSKNDMKFKSMHVYPNPAKDHFTIVLQNFGTSVVSIYNVLGSLVYQEIAKNNMVKIQDANKLNPGMYIIKVKDTENNNALAKLIIK
ncbi:T9SS type A sorting domain-containing protein [Siansivirga zeaxanthinifaciens]|uniref:T9SS type A sorting domain-containing protein n=1 Tax=Siansivirga zeaxanthinifaciens TaxID=762954 RepID=UPI001C54CBDA|nr:Ig-like domain-containing protein [Siansivirga zeaxanthinifaciens]